MDKTSEETAEMDVESKSSKKKHKPTTTKKSDSSDIKSSQIGGIQASSSTNVVPPTKEEIKVTEKIFYCPFENCPELFAGTQQRGRHLFGVASKGYNTKSIVDQDTFNECKFDHAPAHGYFNSKSQGSKLYINAPLGTLAKHKLLKSKTEKLKFKQSLLDQVKKNFPKDKVETIVVSDEEDIFETNSSDTQNLERFCNAWKKLPSDLPFHQEVATHLDKVVAQDKEHAIPRFKECEGSLWTGTISFKDLMNELLTCFQNIYHYPYIFFKSGIERTITEVKDIYKEWIAAMFIIENHSQQWTGLDLPFGSIWQVPVGNLWNKFHFKNPSWWKSWHQMASLNDGAAWHIISTISGHVTDLHIDPHTLSGLTAVITGVKLWFWWPPSDHNLRVVSSFIENPGLSEDDELFFIKYWDKLEDVQWNILCPGQYLVVPKGQIHCVLSIGNSAICGCMFTNLLQEYKDLHKLFKYGLFDITPSSDTNLFEEYSNQIELWISAFENYNKSEDKDKELAEQIEQVSQ